MDVPDPFAWLRELGIDLAHVLHGAQGFRYFAPVYAGDRLTFASRIEDVVPEEARRADVHHQGDRRDQPGQASGGRSPLDHRRAWTQANDATPPAAN